MLLSNPPNVKAEKRRSASFASGAVRLSQAASSGRTFRERSDENALSFASATTILADTVNFAGGIGGEIRLMTT